MRDSIARGEALFNTKAINLTGSSLPDKLPRECVGCHEVPNVGNQSTGQTFATGTSDATPVAPLNVSGLPVFTIQCNDPASPLMGQIFNVTDPGRALITGNCEDIGAVKVPILRGLAARAPYFHNGSAATLADVVEFYDQRFKIGFTDQEKRDLVDFLEAL